MCATIGGTVPGVKMKLIVKGLFFITMITVKYLFTFFNRVCFNQFKCKKTVDTSICVSVDNVCDNWADCPYGDDEFFCHPRIPTCPHNCACLVLAMSCWKTMNIVYDTLLPYVMVWQKNSGLDDLSRFLTHFNQSVYFDLQGNAISEICKSLSTYEHGSIIRHFQVSANEIYLVSRGCFHNMTYLKVFNSSFNKIKSIERFSFKVREIGDGVG